MSRPGLGLDTLNIVFIQKSIGDKDDCGSQRNQSERTVIINKVQFEEEIIICFFHQRDKVLQIKDSKQHLVKETLK